MKKKVIAILLSLSMIIGIMPTLAFATSGETTPVTETTAPTESTPSVCSVCQAENCTVEHKQCEICKAYDCAKAHVFCETCQKYDCGVDHNVEPVSEPELCTTCGKKDCSGQHENWCETCKKDNCGIDHSAPKTCETCGETLSEGHTCPIDPVCSCSVLCKADAPKNDCPVCCAEGGVCTGSDKYVTVQAMIDALRTEFKESEREAALAEYEAVTKAIGELSEEEFALLDLTNYYAAANPTVIPEGPVVCKIGDTDYSSLSDAISAANNAGSATTIILTSDITLSEKLTITGNVTINGEGHTIIRGKTADDAWYTGTLFNVTINGDVTVTGVLTNNGTITGTVTLYIPAGANPNDYFKNTGTHTGDLIVYYTVTDDYPYVLNLYYNGGTDQVGWSGSGHLKWGPNNAETMEVTLADITNAVTVTKYGYTFAGWYYDEELTQPVTDPITLTAKTAECLYAAWEKNRAEINYMAVTQNYGKQAAVSTSGGTVSGSETVDAMAEAVSGSAITVNNGYTFKGWFTDAACTQKVIDSWVDANNKLTPRKNSDGLYESGSYYALFEEMTTTVIYKTTGNGEVCFKGETAAESITDTFGMVTGSPKTAIAKPANGYMFVGWYTDEACTMLHSTSVELNANESGTFYAKFIKDHATVTITKTIDKASSSDQSFILNISGTTYKNELLNVDVVIVIPEGQTSGCVKVVLPVSNGEYSISDQDGWNWRYKVKDNATITINGGDSDIVLLVTSTLENSKWFADSCVYPYKKES